MIVYGYKIDFKPSLNTQHYRSELLKKRFCRYFIPCNSNPNTAVFGVVMEDKTFVDNPQAVTEVRLSPHVEEVKDLQNVMELLTPSCERFVKRLGLLPETLIFDIAGE